MTQYQLPPQHAAFAGGMNYPSPAQLTPAQFGVFRQPSVGPMINQGLPMGFGGAFSPGLPMTMFPRIAPPSPFMRPMEAALERGQAFGQMRNLVGSEAIQLGAQGLLGAASGMIGTGMGAAAGAAVGGAFFGGAGAFTGADIGSALGGMFLAPAVAQNPFLQRATAAAFRPGIQRAVDTSRIMGATRNFAVSGPDLDITGRGFSMEASRAMMQDFTEMAKASGGQFTRQDLVELLQASGEQGLLDFVQNKDQVVDSVKKVSSLVGTMAQITGDPDFKNNIRMMGQLQRFGVEMGQQEHVMRQMSMYARGAGMDVQTLMEQGGAAVAAGQAAGIVPGLALQQGGFGAMLGRQAVAGGAMDPMQLAILGGQQGVNQRVAEMQMGFLGGQGMQSLLPYLVEQGKGGELEINQARLARLRSGEVSYEEMISQGAAGMDPKMLQQILSQNQELVNKISEQLGPQGTFVTMVKQVEQMQRRLGGADKITVASAAQALGMTQQQARQFELMYQDPDTINNMIAQQQVERRNLMFEQRQEEDRRRESMGGWGSRLRSRYGIGAGPDISRPWTRLQEGVGDWMTDRAEAERLAGLGLETPARSRALQAFMSDPAMQKAAASAQAPLAIAGTADTTLQFGFGRREVTGMGEAESKFWRQYGGQYGDEGALGYIPAMAIGAGLEREYGLMETMFGIQGGPGAAARVTMERDIRETGRATRKMIRADDEAVIRQANRLRQQLREAGVSEEEIEGVVTKFRSDLATRVRETRRGFMGLGEAKGIRGADYQASMRVATAGLSKGVQEKAVAAIGQDVTGAVAEIRARGASDLEEDQLASVDLMTGLDNTRAKDNADRKATHKTTVDVALQDVGFSKLDDISNAEVEALKMMQGLSSEEAQLLAIAAWAKDSPKEGEEAKNAYLEGLRSSGLSSDQLKKLDLAWMKQKRRAASASDDVRAALAKMAQTTHKGGVAEVKTAGGFSGKVAALGAGAPGVKRGVKGVALGTKEGRELFAKRVSAAQSALPSAVKGENLKALRTALMDAGVEGVTESSTLEEMVSAYGSVKDEDVKEALREKIGGGAALLEEMSGEDLTGTRGKELQTRLFGFMAKPEAGAARIEGKGIIGGPSKGVKEIDKSIAELQRIAATRQNDASETFKGSVQHFDEVVKKLSGMDLKNLLKEDKDP